MAADVKGGPAHPDPHGALRSSQPTPGREGRSGSRLWGQGSGQVSSDRGAISTKFTSPWSGGEAGTHRDWPHEEI